MNLSFLSKQLILVLAALLLVACPTLAQSPQTAGLRKALAQATTDTSRVLLLADLSASFRYSRFDSVRKYALQGLRLAERIGYEKGQGRCLSRLGLLIGERGNLPQALRTNLRALQFNEASHDLEGTARTLNQTGLLYYALDDFRPSLGYYFRALRTYEHARTDDDSQLISVFTNIGASYEGLKMLDSAAFFLDKAYQLTTCPLRRAWSSWGNPTPYVLREKGLLESARGRYQEALRYYRLSAQAAIPENDQRSRCRAYHYMADLFRARQQTDSSIYYARKSLAVGLTLPFIVGVIRTSNLLADSYRARSQRDSTLKYLEVMLAAQDSLYNPKRIKQLDAIGFAEQQRLVQLEQERKRFTAQLRLYGLGVGLAVLLLATLLLWRYSRQQEKANAQLQALNDQVTQQKEELTQQRDRLAQMVQELRSAQGKLVLREKMASLGELMAGVAHEMQHPMNNVKNFAAISVSLCQELREELAKVPLPIDEQEIIDEMFQNLSRYQTRIVKDSQRAEAVVDSMLEYSSTTPAQRQPTDLNALANDYLRFTYHDLRLKNPHFNAALLPHLDPELPLVPVVRQDLARVLVSLFTNAFYAVQQRQRRQEEGYVPQVSVQTKRVGTEVEIRVRDNGLGIPESAYGSLFQRFYTTKPQGEGAGLGLSVSHNIITKGHGGTLTVESQEGEYSEFIIRLPLEGTRSAWLS